MKNQFLPATPGYPGQIPINFIADDATGADQLALGIVEILGQRVITTDIPGLRQGSPSFDVKWVRVVNSGARALTPEQAQTQNQFLAQALGESSLPVLQIDSRLRGIGNALRGLYDVLDFDFLLFVPAEPELGRLTQADVFCHLEDGRLVPIHASELGKTVIPALRTSHLGEFIAEELGISVAQTLGIPGSVVGESPDALVKFVRGSRKSNKMVLIPDVTEEAHFQTISQAVKSLGRVLVAGSRTFLHSFFASLTATNVATPTMKSLSQSICRQKRGAPLAVVSSLETAMNSQIDYARQALGPNLVTVEFHSSVALGDAGVIASESERVGQLVGDALSAMRPVLLQTSRSAVSSDPTVQQKQLDALSRIIAGKTVQPFISALFISGGQTAETLRKALDISAIEIKGAFQENIPWGVALEGSFKDVPLVTKGGRMGKENVLCEFFEQGHLLPRANVLPVVTPMTQGKEVDEAAIEKLIGHLVRLGTTDIFAVGNAGEFRFLNNAQRLQAIDAFARKARGKLRVFAGITGDTAEETRANYEAASRLDVHAAVVMPLYFLKNSDDILPFVRSLVAPKLPLILYNNPERTKGQHISFEAVEALPFPVVAIKDSSGDLDRLDRYARTLPVYEGQQRQILEGFQHGARGAIGIIGHVTSLPNELFAAGTTFSRREEIARQINDLSKVAKQGGAEVAAYKYLLSLMGVIGDTVASNEAARELTDAQRELIRTNNAELISQLRAP